MFCPHTDKASLLCSNIFPNQLDLENLVKLWKVYKVLRQTSELEHKANNTDFLGGEGGNAPRTKFISETMAGDLLLLY